MNIHNLIQKKYSNIEIYKSAKVGDKLVVLTKPFYEKKEAIYKKSLGLFDLKGINIWWLYIEDNTSDYFVGFEIKKDKISASSWYCYTFLINLADGKILKKVFTK